MQLPVAPPDFDALLQDTVACGATELNRVLNAFSEVDEQGRYLHWDKLRHLPAQAGFTPEQWWLAACRAFHSSALN